jgi:hypothetical protein
MPWGLPSSSPCAGIWSVKTNPRTAYQSYHVHADRAGGATPGAVAHLLLPLRTQWRPEELTGSAWGERDWRNLAAGDEGQGDRELLGTDPRAGGWDKNLVCDHHSAQKICQRTIKGARASTCKMRLVSRSSGPGTTCSSLQACATWKDSIRPSLPVACGNTASIYHTNHINIRLILRLCSVQLV